MSTETNPEKTALAFKFDPYSAELLEKSGRLAGKLVYSLADYPTQTAEHSVVEDMPEASLFGAAVDLLVEKELHGKSFGVNLQTDQSGLIRVSLDVPSKTLEGRVLRNFSEFAHQRSGYDENEDPFMRALELNTDDEDVEVLNRAFKSPEIARLSVRCLGLQVKAGSVTDLVPQISKSI